MKKKNEYPRFKERLVFTLTVLIFGTTMYYMGWRSGNDYTNLSNIETVDVNDITFDTLRVNVVILDNDTINGVSHIDLTKLNGER